jgi:lactoylglutathione lyase
MARLAGRQVVVQFPWVIKFLHTRIRVNDMERSIAFYEKLGYTLGRKKDSPQGNKLAFMELPSNDVFLELTWSPDYTAACPEDLMHTCLGVNDIVEYCDKLENRDMALRMA